MTHHRVIRAVTTLGLLAGLSLSVTAARAADQEALIRYFRKKSNLPPTQKVTVSDLKDSTTIKGAKEGRLEIEGQAGKGTGFIASADLQYVAFGAAEDITKHPGKATMDKLSLKGEPAKGGQNAKVTIVEWSDFQCPFCKKGFDVIEKEVLTQYGDKVKFYFKHFPLGFHPWAEPSAVATECAKEQNADAYWKLYGKYFEHQGEVNPQNVKDKALEWLKETKVDVAKFTDCYDNKKTLAKVKAQMSEGQSVGVTGTPAFIINGRFISGARPFQSFKDIIDDEIASGGL